MSLQLAFAWSEETEKELKAMGFVKRELYVREAPWPVGCTGSVQQCHLGDEEFFRMNSPPYQFITISFWGMGNGK